MRIRTIALTCALAAPMWMACGDTDSDGTSAPELQPLTVEEVPQTSANNVESMVDGAADAMAFVEDTDFMDTITDMFGGDEASDCITWDEMTGEEVPCDDMGGEEDEGSMAEGLSDMAKDVADWLKDDVLVDGTESDDGLTVTYVISPETICDFGGDDDEHPEPMDAPSMMPMEPADDDSDEGEQAMPEIEQCYQQALAEVPDLSGRISVKFVIRGEDGVGRVSKVDIKEAEFDDVPMEDCILDEVEALEFDPPVGGGIVIVSYPFVFEQD